jgi:hypothetical protein
MKHIKPFNGDVLNDKTTMLKIGKTNAIEVNWIKIKR